MSCKTVVSDMSWASCHHTSGEGDESDDQKLLNIVNSRQLRDPFCLEDAQEDATNILPLINIATRIVLQGSAVQLFKAYPKSWHWSNVNCCWATIKYTWEKFLGYSTTVVEKKKVKSADDKFISVAADFDLIGWQSQGS